MSSYLLFSFSPRQILGSSLHNTSLPPRSLCAFFPHRFTLIVVLAGRIVKPSEANLLNLWFWAVENKINWLNPNRDKLNDFVIFNPTKGYPRVIKKSRSFAISHFRSSFRITLHRPERSSSAAPYAADNPPWRPTPEAERASGLASRMERAAAAPPPGASSLTRTAPVRLPRLHLLLRPSRPAPAGGAKTRWAVDCEQ